MGMIVEHVKHFTLFQWSVEDLCEDGTQLVSTGFQIGWCHAIWAWSFPSLFFQKDLVNIIFIYLEYRGEERVVVRVDNGGVESGSGVWRETGSLKSTIELIQVINQLLIAYGVGDGIL